MDLRGVSEQNSKGLGNRLLGERKVFKILLYPLTMIYSCVVSGQTVL